MIENNEFRFLKACRGESTDVTPIWFMRRKEPLRKRNDSSSVFTENEFHGQTI